MRRKVVAGCMALVAGAGAAVGVATGAESGCCVLTISGADFVKESARGAVLTIEGGNFADPAAEYPITIIGRSATATAGRDFDGRPQVVTISGRAPSGVVTIGITDDEADEPDERWWVDAKGPELADGTPGETTSRIGVIVDDDGILDALICATPLNPLFKDRSLSGDNPLFGGCSK